MDRPEVWLAHSLPEGEERLRLLQALADQLSKDLDTDFRHLEPEAIVQSLLNFCREHHMASDHIRGVLYRIDVSEAALADLLAHSGLQEHEAVAFAILQREWQKVRFRRYFK